MIATAWLAGVPPADAQGPPNRPPSSQAIPAQEAAEGGFFELDVSAYFRDPDDDPLTYTASGLPAGLTLQDGLIAGQPGYDTAGVHVIRVAATDGQFDAATSVALTVADTNRPPVQIDDIPGTTAAEGGAFELDLREYFADPDGDPLAFSAVNLPPNLGLTANGIVAGTVSHTAANDSPYTVGVTVDDGNGGEAAGTFTFSVTATHQPPLVANEIDDQAFMEGDEVSIDLGAVFTDPDTDALTLTADGLPPGLGLTQAHVIAGTIAAGAAGNAPYAVTVSASDGTAPPVSTGFAIDVVPPPPAPNRPPVRTDQPLPSPSHLEGAEVIITLAPYFTDPDGDDLTFAAQGLPSGLAIAPATGVVSGTLGAGTANDSPYTVTITVRDDDDAAVDQFVITVVATNRAPEQTSAIPPASLTAGAEVDLDVSAHYTDPDGDPLTFAASGLPTGVGMNAAGRITGTLAAGAATGSPYTVSVIVSDGDAEIAASFVLSVMAGNRPPQLTAPVAAQQFAEGDVVSFDVSGFFADPDGDPLSFSATGLPVGVAISTTGQIGGTVSAGAANGSPYSATVTASDGAGTASATFSVLVTRVNQPPSLPVVPTLSTPEDTPLTITPQRLGVVDDDLSRVVVAVTPPAPGANFSVQGATVRPAPDFNGTIVVEVRISDQEFELAPVPVTINVAPANDAPRIDAIPPQSLSELVPYTLVLSDFVHDVENDPLTYSVDGLPPGLAFDPASATISGVVPLGTERGAYEARLTVSDGTDASQQLISFSLLAADEADLEAAIEVSPVTVLINEEAVWTTTVRNLSMVDVANLELSVVFSGSAAVQIDLPADPACGRSQSGNDAIITCRLAPLVGGDSRNVTITGRGTQAGSVVAVARVDITDALPVDPIVGNDEASAALNVTQSLSGGPSQQLTAPGARAVVAAPLDDNDTVDLAVATAAGEPTLVFLNVPGSDTGAIAFAGMPISAGDVRAAYDISAGDLDGDGDIDLVLTGPDGPLVLVNDGSATFEAMPVGLPGSDGQAVVVADLDGDGWLDLVFANDGPNTVVWNLGGLQFEASSLGAGASVDVIAVDLFGDANLELVFANADGDATIHARGSDGYERVLALSTGATTSVAAADFNADGRMDLVFGRDTAVPAVTSDLVFLNTSSSAATFFLAEQLGGSATADVLTGDFDVAGRADIVSIGAAGSHRLYRNAGAASTAFLLHPEQFTTAAAWRATSGRLNSDARDDIAVAAGDTVSIFLNDGTGHFGAGDTGAPAITLLGSETVTLTVGDTYSDAGATAHDALDGDLSEHIAVDNPVDTEVIGTYTITYDVTDSSGNAAPTVTRTVEVQARAAQGGGGGGAVSWEWLALALVLAIVLHGRLVRVPGPGRRNRREASTTKALVPPRAGR